MLKQEPGHKRRQDQPVTIAQHAERSANKSKRRSIQFDGSLDIPFAVELSQPRLDLVGMLRKVRNAILDFLLDALIDAWRSMGGHTITRRWDHGGTPSMFQRGTREMVSCPSAWTSGSRPAARSCAASAAPPSARNA